MTHPKKDIELVEILQASCADGDDVLRSLMVHMLQRVLEEEIKVFLNAETYERTDKRKGYRNSYKPRTLKTRVGRIELMVPKDREGRFQTELFVRCRRNEKALTLAIMEMYVQGVSTRKVKNMNCEEVGAIVTC